MKKKVGRYIINITHQDRVLFPKLGITKGDLINYYEHIGPVMLPYIKDRLLTMHRFPEGIDKGGFYHKDAPDYFPSWIKRVPVEKQGGGIVNYVVANHTATLVYLAQQACITPHLWLSKINKLDYPDQIIFDLDPPKGNFALVVEAALLLKAILENIGLVPFVKTTGSKGLHVVIPIRRSLPFDDVRAFAKQVAQVLVDKYPTKFTLDIRKEHRKNKLFLDTVRNAFGQTAVAPYAVRALSGAPVAAPLFWDQLKDKKLTSQKYTINSIFKRLKIDGDPWAEMQKHAKSIKGAMKKVSS